VDAPFLFGKTVSEDAFTNRQVDIKRLTGKSSEPYQYYSYFSEKMGQIIPGKKGNGKYPQPQHTGYYA